MTVDINQYLGTLRYLSNIADPTQRAASATIMATDLLGELIALTTRLAAAEATIRAIRPERTTVEDQTDDIMSAILSSGAKGIDLTDLGAVVSSIPSDRRNAILARMIRDGLIESWQESTGGRPRTMFRRTGLVNPNQQEIQ